MSRTLRPPRGGGAYVPPHLRGNTSSSTPGAARTLDELAPHNMHIKVHFTSGGPFSFDECPDNILQTPQQRQEDCCQQQEAADGCDQRPLSFNTLDSPACPDQHQIQELLIWFQKASSMPHQPDYPNGDTRAVLSLPAHLSKRERAIWHEAAQSLGLASESTGVGDARHLQIRPGPNRTEQSWHKSGTVPQQQRQRPIDSAIPDAACTTQARSASQEVSIEPATQRAPQPRLRGSRFSTHSPDVQEVWHWCQMEGGAFEKYSLGEVHELLSAGQSTYPAEFVALLNKRQRAAALAAALQQKDEAAALDLLANSPPNSKLGWLRDTQSGGYPAHIAAWHGLGAFIRQLIDIHGIEILQQHDAARQTPIALAQQRGHYNLAAELEQLQLHNKNSQFSSDSISRTRVSVPPLDSSTGTRGGVLGFVGGRGFGKGRVDRTSAGSSCGAGMGSTAVNAVGDGSNTGQAVLGADRQAEGNSATVEVQQQDRRNRTASDYCDGSCSEPHQHVNQQHAAVSEAGIAPASMRSAGKIAVQTAGQTVWGGDFYCSYTSSSDRAFVLYGRPGKTDSSSRRGGRGVEGRTTSRGAGRSSMRSDKAGGDRW